MVLGIVNGKIIYGINKSFRASVSAVIIYVAFTIISVWKDFFVGALIVVGTGISAMQVTRSKKAGLRNMKKEAVK